MVAGSNPAAGAIFLYFANPSRTTVYKLHSSFFLLISLSPSLPIFPLFFERGEERFVPHSSPAFSIYSTLGFCQVGKLERCKTASLETDDYRQPPLSIPTRAVAVDHDRRRHFRVVPDRHGRFPDCGFSLELTSRTTLAKIWQHHITRASSYSHGSLLSAPKAKSAPAHNGIRLNYCTYVILKNM